MYSATKGMSVDNIGLVYSCTLPQKGICVDTKSCILPQRECMLTLEALCTVVLCHKRGYVLITLGHVFSCSPPQKGICVDHTKSCV